MKQTISVIIVLAIIFSLLSLWFARPMYFGTRTSELDNIEKEFFISNTNKVYSEQLKYREKAIEEYQKNLSAIKRSGVDTLLGTDPISNKIQLRYLLPKTKTSFVIPLNNYTLEEYFLVGYDTLFIEYSIDEEKINSIIQDQNIKPNDFINVLKHQDYLKITKHASKHLRFVGLVIYIGIFIFSCALVSFIVIESSKPEESKEVLSEMSLLKNAFGIKNRRRLIDEEFKEIDLNELKSIYSERLKRFERELEEIKQRSTAYFILQNIVRKAELKSKEIHSRSNLMLVAGLVMAFIGVSIFYLTLPTNISATTDVLKIISLSIRPTLILIFIEAISWYLLKQHKSLLSDYRYYHSIYNKKVGYLAAFQLINENETNDENLRTLIPVMLLSEEIKNIENEKEDDTIVETSNGLLSSLLDKVVNKF